MKIVSKPLNNTSNRIDLFLQWWEWSLQHGDCDPAMWLMNYLNERYEHNDEQKLWFCFLYGNTYNLPTTWVFLNEFPDFELATVERMEWWNNENYPRQRYQVDCKWNKGHLPKMFASYQEWIYQNGSTQREAFDKFCQGDEIETFDALWREIKGKWFKFGRYGTWFVLQAYRQTADVPMQPGSLFLSDYKGSRSHRNGLLRALGKDDWIDEKLTPSSYEWLEDSSLELLDEMVKRGYKTDLFDMETVLCSFKKIFREKKGRYLGYYLDRQSEEIEKAEGDGWSGIEWKVLWQAREETLDPRLSSRRKVSKEKMKSFLRTGAILDEN